jgi:hypothetical protein
MKLREAAQRIKEDPESFPLILDEVVLENSNPQLHHMVSEWKKVPKTLQAFVYDALIKIDDTLNKPTGVMTLSDLTRSSPRLDGHLFEFRGTTYITHGIVCDDRITIRSVACHELGHPTLIYILDSDIEVRNVF